MAPKFDFSFVRALSELKRHLPIRPGWFSPMSLDPESSQLGRLLHAIAGQVAEWYDAVGALKDSLFLMSATGADLDLWAADLGLFRYADESDEALRLRLRNELLRLRVVRRGIEEYLSGLSGIPVTVYQPWTDELWYDDTDPDSTDEAYLAGFGFSGTHVFSSEYYQGGVIDIRSEGYSQMIRHAAPEVVAAGVKIYYSPYLDSYAESGASDVPSRRWGIDLQRTIPLFDPNPVYDGEGAWDGYYTDSSEQTRLEWTRLVAIATTNDAHIQGVVSYGYITLAPNTTPDEQPPVAISLGLMTDCTDSVVPQQPAVVVAGIAANGTTNPVLYDLPEIGQAYTVHATNFTWDDLADVAWDQAITGGFWNQKPCEITYGHR